MTYEEIVAMGDCPEREKKMMSTPSAWLGQPNLPVKRTLCDMEIGILNSMASFPQGVDGPVKVFKCNLFLAMMNPGEIEDAECEEFESLDALIAAGWKVD